MAKYMLVSFKTCPWVQRSAIILREKNTPFEFRHIEPDNRPDWFLAISPHKKVPVIRIDDKDSLFESNAINEYLDETVAPRLHPSDPLQRAVNRAWTDYVPTFASSVTGCAYAATKEAYEAARPIRWSMPPTRRSCSAISSSTGSRRSARSRNIRGSMPGPRR
jgi:glutathione S-transferase